MGPSHRNLCYAVGRDFLVTSWRDILESDGIITKFFIMERWTKKEKVINVLNLFEFVESMTIVSSSILVVMSRGPVAEIGFQPVYTLDLSKNQPEDSLLSFTGPVSEARPLGRDKIVCRRDDGSNDHFLVYSLAV